MTLEMVKVTFSYALKNLKFFTPVSQYVKKNFNNFNL